MDEQAIRLLIDEQPKGRALAQPFYTDADIYQRDIEHIFMKSWLYAGHVSEIPRTGDYFLFELAGESVIIMRSSETGINAIINVCRHRGSKVCLETKGCAKKLVCRYHAWVYELDGSLRSAPHMTDEFEPSELSLKRIQCETLDGMIYINFSEQAASFDSIRNGLSACLRPYRLDKAKVADRRAYSIDANWKLSVENYTECYHCAPSHPEYSRGHSLAKPGARATEMMTQVMAKARECGLSENKVSRLYENAEAFGADYFYERYPMWRGHVTGSDDGQPVAPFLGDIRGYDGGTSDFQAGPVTFALAYCDYVVIYRFTPVSLHQSECDITWLVNEDAEEGRDYDRDRLTWLWDVTTLADKRIIEYNAEGVNSRFYEPGPLSTMEVFTGEFQRWYLRAIRP